MTVIPLPGRMPMDPELPAGRWHGGLWVSSEPVADTRAYVMALATYDSTGLSPVLIPPDERFECSGEDWVDRDGLPPALDEVDHRSAETVLREWWP